MLQITDISWKYDSSLQRYLRRLKLYDDSDKELKKIPLDNYVFNFKLSEKKYCIGYYDKDEYVACKFNNAINKKGFDLCYYCESKEGFRSAFLFGNPANENMKEYLAKKHFIYLAFFAPDKIKVGTASESRNNIRLIEQDALVFAFIAENDGFNIQKFERKISKTFLEIKETVNSSFKFKHLTQKPNIEYASSLIKESYNKILNSFKDDRNFGDWLYKNIEIVNLSILPEIYYPPYQPILITNELNICGKFLGLRGKFLILENNKNIVAFDIRDLIGRNIEGYVEDYRYEVSENSTEGQIGLDI